MLDRLTLKIQISDVTNLLNRLPWKKYSDSKTDEVIRYQGQFEGLFYQLRGNTLTITNSLHKFYKKCNNDTFTLTENLKALNKLSELFGIDFQNARVTKFEFGVNILLKTDPKLYLRNIQGFKPKGFVPFDSSHHGHTLYYLTESYCFKIYNKSREMNCPGNILRFEICRLNPSKFLPSLISINKIISNEGFVLLAKALLGKFDRLIFSESWDISMAKPPKPNEMYLLHCLITMGRPKLINLLQSSYPKRQYKDELKKINRIRTLYPAFNMSIQNELRDLIKKELIFILNN